ncbi:MAG: YfhO family protein [Planctomycetota bacterium]
MLSSDSPVAPAPSRRLAMVAILAVFVAPLLWLGPCLLGGRTFVPYDLAQFPPVSTKLTAEEIGTVKRGHNTDVSEIPVTFLPEMRFAKQEIDAGRLPEWNPYARTGAPLLATSVVGLLYPPNWLVFLPDDPRDGLSWLCYASVVIGGLLMLGFLRALGLDPDAAAFGAIAFVLSGTAYANAHFYQRLAALIWLPGMLWATHCLAHAQGRRRLRPAAALAVCTAMEWLAGFPSFAAGALLVWGLYAAYLAWPGVTGRAADSPRLLGGLALVIVLGFALAAIQLVPMFAFFPESNRTVAPTPDQIAVQSFDPAGLLGLLLPDAFGHPSATEAVPYGQSPLVFALFDRASWETGRPFLPNYNFTEYTLFPGTLPLLLAVAGLVCGAGAFRRVALLGWVLLLVLAAAPSWLAPLYHLPGLTNVPPIRFAAPSAVLLAALAGFGLQAVGRQREGRWWALAAGAAVLSLAVFGVAIWLRAQEPAALLDALRPGLAAHYAVDPSVVDSYLATTMKAAHGRLADNLGYGGTALMLGALWLVMVPLARFRPAPILALRLLAIVATVAQLSPLARGVAGGRTLRHDLDTEIHTFLRQQRDAHRGEGGFTVARGANREEVLPTVLPPCTLVPERIRDLNAYTFVDKHSHRPVGQLWGPQQLLREFWIRALPDPPGSPQRGALLQHPYLDLLGVRYVLSTTELKHAGSPVGPQWSGPSGEVFIYERQNALPRAFTVPRLDVLPNDDAVIEALVAPEFAPRQAALITQADAAELVDPAPRAPEASNRAVRFVRDVPNEIVLDVAEGPAAYLILTDTYMSGWTATVGGQAAHMRRVNLFMRGVYIPAGTTKIEFRYQTPRLLAGTAVTGLAMIALFALIWLGRPHRHARAFSPSSFAPPPKPRL